MTKIFILNGPNLNWLGKREPQLYGSHSLSQLETEWIAWASDFGFSAECRQSNHEGVLIDWLQEAQENCAGVVINPGGYAHTSVALRDCVAALTIPVVEVHWTAIQKREPFRHHSFLGEVATGTVAGFGALSYVLGLVLLKNHERTQ